MSSFFVWFTLYLTFVPASSFISLNLSTYFPPVFIPFLFSIFLCFSSLVPFLRSFLFYFPFFLLTSFPYLELPSDLISRLFCDFNCRFCNFPFSFLLFFSHIIFSPFSFSPFFLSPFPPPLSFPSPTFTPLFLLFLCGVFLGQTEGGRREGLGRFGESYFSRSTFSSSVFVSSSALCCI